MREELRGRGGRVTPQREIVLEALHRMPGHVTAEEVYDEIRSDHPNVNLSTVYRTLELFEELGLVYHTHMGHGPGSYHLSSRGTHDHLVCRRCGREMEAEIRALREVTRELIEEHGFEPDFSHFAVVGRCKACRGGSAG